MIDRPIKKSVDTQDVRTPQMDNAMRQAVNQLHEIAQAAASQKESDAKILAAAISSSHTLRDVWQQKATRWRRAVWACACCGIIATGAIGLFSWQNLRQANLHQIRLRHEIVERGDEINSLRMQASMSYREASQHDERDEETAHIETMISGNAQNVNVRFDALAISSENLVQKVTDLARQQKSLLSAMTQMLQGLDNKREAPVYAAPVSLNQKSDPIVAKIPTAIIPPRRDTKATTSTIRLLRSRPVESDMLSDYIPESPQLTWQLSDSFLNPTGHCIPGKPSNK